MTSKSAFILSFFFQVTGLTYKVKDQSVSGRMPSTNTIPSADESDEVEIVVGNVNDLERGKYVLLLTIAYQKINMAFKNYKFNIRKLKV